MSVISLLYAHDSRDGRQGYRVLAQSVDVARSQLTAVEALITRLSLDARALLTPGYFALWLSSDVRIFGRAAVQMNGHKKTLECRMLVFSQSDSTSSILKWFDCLNDQSQWEVQGESNLAKPQVLNEVPKADSQAARSPEILRLPWSVIAGDCQSIAYRWFSELSEASQRKACFLAPCLCSEDRIRDYLSDVFLLATLQPVPAETTTSNRCRSIFFKAVGITLLCSVLLNFILLNQDGETTNAAPSTFVEVPAEQIKISEGATALTFKPKQEQELEKLCKGLRSLVQEYQSFTLWNQQVSGDGKADGLKEKLSFINGYLAYAEDPANSLDGRLKQLTYAMGEIGSLLEQPQKVSDSVDQLLVRLGEANGFISKMRSNLAWQKDRATPDFKKATQHAEELIKELEQALRDLKIRIEKRNDDVDAILRTAYSVELQEKRKITL